MAVAEVAGSASVASGVVGSAAGGSTFNNGVTPAVAAFILRLSLLLRFCFFCFSLMRERPDPPPLLVLVH